MSERLYRPISLRAQLAASSDATTIPGWYRLAEDVLLFDGDDSYRKLCVESFRRWAKKWLEQSERLGDIGLDQASLERYLWKAEALEDPELAARLEFALPEDTRNELADRSAAQALGNPVPLTVDY
ncbi:MAG TPA: hypothetical protein VF711_04465 [Acidimicrobiales bacterium]|jgi:hypothetical protein